MPIGLNLATPSNRISLMSEWETKLPRLMILKKTRNHAVYLLDVSLMNKMLEETGKKPTKFGQTSGLFPWRKFTAVTIPKNPLLKGF
jgi:hypothetical protein